jgi:hypothetical protein
MAVEVDEDPAALSDLNRQFEQAVPHNRALGLVILSLERRARELPPALR